MIYITGDLHGDKDRFKSAEFKKLRRKDTLIVLGDFGFLWDGSAKEKRRLKWLGKRKYNLLFIEGTHDNYDLLAEYPIEEFAGGKARKLGGKLRQLMRGEIFEVEGKSLFCFGGGETADADLKNEGSWWKEEMPSEQELQRAVANLEEAKWKVDYILTHEGPGKLVRFIEAQQEEPNRLCDFFDALADKTEYRRWLFAKYHRDLAISAKAALVYKKLILLNEK